MGEVHVARQRGHAGFERLVAVKLVLPEIAEDPELMALFADEARIAGHLAHPNIVRVYEFGEADGRPYLAMEYVPGQTLGRLLQRMIRDKRRLPRELAVYVVSCLLDALAHAHEARDDQGTPLAIVHRDISPSNLLVSYAGDVKLMDFGIAKATNRRTVTMAGNLRGKFPYMSPEQARGDPLDRRTDVWSSGVVLWETTLMRRLFRGDDIAVMREILAGAVVRPSEVDPDYPAELQTILLGALTPDRDARTPTASAMAAQLRVWLDRQGHAAGRDELAALLAEVFAEEQRSSQLADRTPPVPDTPTVPTPFAETPTVPTPLAEAPTAATPREMVPTVATPHAQLPTAAAEHDRPPPTRSRTSLLALGGGALAVAGIATALVLGSRPAAPAIANVTDAATATLERDASSIDSALDAAVVIAIPDDARAPRDAPPAIRHDAAPERVVAPVRDAALVPDAAVTAALTVDAAAPAPQLGTLTIAPDSLEATIFIGTRTWDAPIHRLKLPVGNVSVRIELWNDRSQLTFVAPIAAGTDTHCTVSGGKVSC